MRLNTVWTIQVSTLTTLHGKRWINSLPIEWIITTLCNLSWTSQTMKSVRRANRSLVARVDSLEDHRPNRIMIAAVARQCRLSCKLMWTIRVLELWMTKQFRQSIKVWRIDSQPKVPHITTTSIAQLSSQIWQRTLRCNSLEKLEVMIVASNLL